MESDWNYLVLSWDYSELSLDKYPNWELYENSPYCVFLEAPNRIGLSSRNIAIEWDDIAIAKFHYRDWTKSSLPFVDDGEVYWSSFAFQYKCDAILFQMLFGGVGNWMEGYDEFVGQCNQKRDSSSNKV